MCHWKFRYVALGSVVCVLFLGMAFGQSGSITRQDRVKFDDFLDAHPAIEKDLQSNPSLANSSSYLSAHPELKQFLASNPNLSQALVKNPKEFMNRENEFDRKGKDLTRAEVKTFDDFLDKHPAIDKDLSKNPSLVNDPNYLAKHPELQTFLNNNPQISNDLREHPRAFMKAERKFDHSETKAAKADLREQRREQRQDLHVASHPGGKH